MNVEGRRTAMVSVVVAISFLAGACGGRLTEDQRRSGIRNEPRPSTTQATDR